MQTFKEGCELFSTKRAADMEEKDVESVWVKTKIKESTQTDLGFMPIISNSVDRKVELYKK